MMEKNLFYLVNISTTGNCNIMKTGTNLVIKNEALWVR